MATAHFVDGVNGNNTNTGHTMDAAFKTVEKAMEAGGAGSGDTIWVRRNVSELPLSDITVNTEFYVIGCPRTTVVIVSSAWTRGSTAVVVDDANMVREAHQARYITGPDGNIYFITRVIDASNIVIDRKYVGATVTNASATISADEDYATFQLIDDSAWTIKKANWNADAHTLPLIDFNEGAFQIYINVLDTVFRNMEFRRSSDANGIIYMNAKSLQFRNCLFRHTLSAAYAIRLNQSSLDVKACTFEGATGYGIYSAYSGTHIVDCAFFNLLTLAVVSVGGMVFLENVNAGVELPFVSATPNAFYATQAGTIIGRDVAYVGIVGALSYGRWYLCSVNIENCQKVLGAHKKWYGWGSTEKTTLVATPFKKISSDVIKVTPDIEWPKQRSGLIPKVLVAEIDALANVSRTYKFWIFNAIGHTLNDTTAIDNIWLKAEYVSAYNDTDEYIISEAFSTQIDILAAADWNDWDYLEVTVNPVVASKVRLSIYFNFYDAADSMYIDPAVQVI